jgi:hypothetical protein
MFEFIKIILDSFFGGLIGSVYRPVKHLMLTIGLYALFVATSPVRIFRRLLYDDEQKQRSLIVTTIATLLAIPFTLALVTMVAAFTVIGSVAISPFVGLVRGLIYGISEAFTPTWLSKTIWSVINVIFNGPNHGQQPFEDQNHVPAIRVIDPAEEPEENFENEAQPVDDMDAENQRQLAEALRVSFNYPQNQNAMGRAANDDQDAAYVTELANQFENLKPIQQAKLDFLTEAEIELLTSSADIHTLQTLKQYNEILENSTCVYGGSGLNEMNDTVTVEITIQTPDPKTKTMRDKTYLFFHDHSDFLPHFKLSATNGVIPEITELRPQTYSGLTLSDNHRTISGTNNDKSIIQMYRGIHAKTYADLNSVIKVLRVALNPQQEEKQHAGERQAFSRSSSASMLHAMPPHENPQPIAATPVNPIEARRNKMYEAARSRISKPAVADVAVTPIEEKRSANKMN